MDDKEHFLVVNRGELLMDKKLLRKTMIEKRDGVDVLYRQKAEIQIKNTLLEKDFYKKSKNIFIYVGFGSEIDTSIYIKKFLEDGKKIYVPRIGKVSRIMDAVEIDGLEDLKANKYGILEPSDENQGVNKDILDLIILPGVAFDENGGRLGYGGGYYDTFLQDGLNGVTKVVLAYDFQIVKALPLEEHDIKADYIITEKRNICIKA